MNTYNETSLCLCRTVLFALAVFLSAVVLAVGLVLGAVFASFFIENIVAVAIFGIIALLLFIITAVIRYCRGCGCGCD